MQAGLVDIWEKAFETSHLTPYPYDRRGAAVMTKARLELTNTKCKVDAIRLAYAILFKLYAPWLLFSTFAGKRLEA